MNHRALWPPRINWFTSPMTFRQLALQPLLVLLVLVSVRAADFIHPGGLHTKADLDRMKTMVERQASPWLEGWQRLVEDPRSRADYRPSPRANLGDSRQAASRDAHAAYLNFMRWHIGGDRAHAERAIRICNEWSAQVGQIPSGRDIPGLSGIPIGEFAMVGELLRICPFWEKDDQQRFHRMMREFFYPVVQRFLDDRNRLGNSHYWSNWDICNIGALLAMGVLLDDRKIFDEGIEYFKHGRGTGSIMNAVYHIHPCGLGQWQESGRDQPHALLAVGLMGQACQIAWNQGVDLFGYADNRLLAGAEYAARVSLSLDVPYLYYNNTSEARNYWLSPHTRGRFSAPIWELLYNHYVVRHGIQAPHLTALANLARPEGGGLDHFGYGSLVFTLDAGKSPYPALRKPATPVGLTAEPGLERVHLRWQPAANLDANGYVVRRAPATGGDFETIAEWSYHTAPVYTDHQAIPGIPYRYVVAARNQAGTSVDSGPVLATAGAPAPLPDGWSVHHIGREPAPAGIKTAASYSHGGGRTLTLRGPGRDIGGREDSTTFAFRAVRGDFELTARIAEPQLHRVGSSGMGKTGLMMRESADPGARCVTITLGEAGLRGTRARFRADPGANARTERGNDYTWAPVWYRLRRSGDTFTAAHSPDGENWFDVGAATISMPADYLAGVVVCTANPDKPATAVFERLSLAASAPASGR